MKRRVLLTVLAALALPASAHAAITFTPAGQYPVGADPYGVVPADFDGDGRVDLAVINGTSSSVSFYRGAGNGTFARATSDLPTDDPGPGGPNWAVARDFTGDGRMDLAVSNYASGRVTLLTQGAAWQFESSLALGRNNATGIVSADFNGDGLPDLAATGEGGTVSVSLRRPTGGFAPATAGYPAGQEPRHLATGDFNGDGRPDLAVANDAGGGVTVLLRNAARTEFAVEGSTIAVASRTVHVAVADFNRDGRADLAVGSVGTNTVRLLLRNAANTGFDVGLPVTVPATPIGLTAGDFDGDGVPDLAVASNGGARVTVLAGGTTPVTALALNRPYGLAAADFNGDGKLDLAASSDVVEGTVSVFTNTSPAVQPPPPPPPSPPPPDDPTPTPPLPEPVAGRTLNATPVVGTVKVKLPGSRRYVDLSQARQLPVGTSVDARKGTIELRAAGNGGAAKFFDGLFKIAGQTKGRRPLTTLTLTEALSCPKAKRASAAAKKVKSRKLWGDGKGAFRTKGRYSAATVRGTKWLVTDRCTTTVTRVRQGSVTVRDTVAKRTVIVRAGRSYTARAKRR